MTRGRADEVPFYFPWIDGLWRWEEINRFPPEAYLFIHRSRAINCQNPPIFERPGTKKSAQLLLWQLRGLVNLLGRGDHFSFGAGPKGLGSGPACPARFSRGVLHRGERSETPLDAVSGSGRGHTGRLAVKHRPADFVSQALVIQHKIANRIRQLLALPLTLKPAGILFLAIRCGRMHGLDRVGCSAEFVGGDMSYRRSLPGSIRRMPRGTGQIPCSRLRMAGCRAGLRHPALAPHPSSCLFDRLARSRISRLHLLKQMQNVLRAVSCPHGEKPVIRVLQRAATANRDESGVAIFGKDHNAPSCERVQGKLSRSFKYSSIAFIYFNLSSQRRTVWRLPRAICGVAAAAGLSSSSWGLPSFLNTRPCSLSFLGIFHPGVCR